jgi:hypothetical protein
MSDVNYFTDRQPSSFALLDDRFEFLFCRVLEEFFVYRFHPKIKPSSKMVRSSITEIIEEFKGISSNMINFDMSL